MNTGIGLTSLAKTLIRRREAGKVYIDSLSWDFGDKVPLGGTYYAASAPGGWAELSDGMAMPINKPTYDRENA